MGFSVLDMFLLLVLVTAPACFIIISSKQRRSTKKFEKFAKHFGLASVYDKSKNDSRHGVIALPIDKILIDDRIIELCTDVPVSAENQKTYTMYANQHHKFWTSYTQHRWDMAIVIAGSLRTAWDSQLLRYYDMMISRCVNFKHKPPSAGWDGTILKD